MPLTELRISNFRNLGSQHLHVPEEGMAVVGENAQGKSNFLEAIYYLETLRSFRGVREDELVAFREDVFRVEGGVTGPGTPGLRLTAAYQRSRKLKKVTVDGGEVERLGDGIGHLGAVIFSPSDTALVSGGPEERRRYLDIVLSLNRPGYLEALQQYRRVLSQRNAALRDGAPLRVLTVWDGPLARAGASVLLERGRWCALWEGRFSAYYRQVSGKREAFLRYRPSLGRGEDLPPDPEGWDEGSVAARFREGLEQAVEQDRRLGFTSVGPQRDDVRLRLDGPDQELDLRKYGSGGQRRTAALALRLVEADTIREAKGHEPLVLMDDAFAELDEGRSERILNLLEAEEKGQVILTAPKEADVRFRRDRMERRKIVDGQIS